MSDGAVTHDYQKPVSADNMKSVNIVSLQLCSSSSISRS